MGPGRTGRIGLHDDDDPQELASSFSRTYQLDAGMEAKLAILIQQYLTEVVPDLAVERAMSDTASEGAGIASGSPGAEMPSVDGD